MNTWYVSLSSNGGSDSNNGSQYSPFATLNHALGVAQGGDTILLYPGTYNENTNSGRLVLNTAYSSTVTISSTTGKASDVTVQGSGTAASSIEINGCQNVAFQNLTLASQNTSQVIAVRFDAGVCQNVSFTNVVFFVKSNGSSSCYAIQIKPGANGDSVSFVTFTDCIWNADNYVGTVVLNLYLATGNGLTDTIHDIVVYDSQFLGGSLGIDATCGTGRTDKNIYNLTFINNQITAQSSVGGNQGSGILLTNTAATGCLDNVLCAFNTISTNFNGLWFQGVTNMNVYENTIVTANECAMIVGTDAPGSLTSTGKVWNNTMTTTNHDCLLIEYGAAAPFTVNGNVLKGTGDVLRIRGNSGVQAYGNTILGGSSNIGINCIGCTGAVVKSNTVLMTVSGSTGLYIQEDAAYGTKPGSNTVEGNLITANGAGVIAVYLVTPGEDLGGEVVNNNVYNLQGGATLGRVNGVLVNSIANMTTQWTTYGAPTNDSNSTLEPGTTVSPTAQRLAFDPVSDTIDLVFLLEILQAQDGGNLEELANIGMAMSSGKMYVLPSLVGSGYGMVIYVLDNGYAVVSVLGTQNPLQLIAQIITSSLVPDLALQGKIGGYYIFELLLLAPALSSILSGYSGKVILSGHSLGGGTAQTLVSWFQQVFQMVPYGVYTFGSPKVGDANEQAYLAGLVTNIENVGDIVPSIPQSLGELSLPAPLGTPPADWALYVANAGPLALTSAGALTPGHTDQTPAQIIASIVQRGFEPHFVSTYLQNMVQTQDFPGNLTPFARGYEKPWILFGSSEVIPPGVLAGTVQPTAIPVPSSFTNKMAVYQLSRFGTPSLLSTINDPPPQSWTPVLSPQPTTAGCC